MTTLGYIMNSLNITTSELSKELHVDASLVSKWKNGKRKIKPNSGYFNNIICYISDNVEFEDALYKMLSEIYPCKEFEDVDDIRELLSDFLSENDNITNKFSSLTKNETKIDVEIYEHNHEKRKAFLKLIDYAKELKTPGKIICIDSDIFNWLIEDNDFSKTFIGELLLLLDKGFTCKFVLQYYSYEQRLVNFFSVFKPLLFHKNIEWFYDEFYDINSFRITQFIIDKAISLLGIGVDSSDNSTMIFTDHNSVFNHIKIAESIIKNSNSVFVDFDESRCMDVIDFISVIRKRGFLYSFFPSPVFLSTSKDLLLNILKTNKVSKKNIECCLELNKAMKNILHTQYHGLNDYPEKSICMLQFDKLKERLKKDKVYSCSLSLICKKDIFVEKEQLIQSISHLIDSLYKYDNLEVVLLSQTDTDLIPNRYTINCWCKQNTWLIEMSERGFRITDEVSLVNAASITFEKTIRKIPLERRNKNYVINELKQLISNT